MLFDGNGTKSHPRTNGTVFEGLDLIELGSAELEREEMERRSDRLSFDADSDAPVVGFSAIIGVSGVHELLTRRNGVAQPGPEVSDGWTLKF